MTENAWIALHFNTSVHCTLTGEAFTNIYIYIYINCIIEIRRVFLLITIYIGCYKFLPRNKVFGSLLHLIGDVNVPKQNSMQEPIEMT